MYRAPAERINDIMLQYGIEQSAKINVEAEYIVLFCLLKVIFRIQKTMEKKTYFSDFFFVFSSMRSLFDSFRFLVVNI